MSPKPAQETELKLAVTPRTFERLRRDPVLGMPAGPTHDCSATSGSNGGSPRSPSYWCRYSGSW